MYFVNHDDLSYLAILENATVIGVKKQKGGVFVISAMFAGEKYSHEIEHLTAAQVGEIIGNDKPLPDRIMYELISRSIYEANNKRDFMRILKSRYEEYCQKTLKKVNNDD